MSFLNLFEKFYLIEKILYSSVGSLKLILYLVSFFVSRDETYSSHRNNIDHI